ncbi:hypothetical protein FA13DRAFT_1720007 [Coprinellus micaceus]|uniref:Uncharacterized protein n=1 Tax=Coprinellus micaceus TaxID=71717 RepID=A0A4Y7SA84_COPMI|nr:hypothetical protein FA13DRAFT_1720007 [Coprinellus micaceus]
MSDRKSGYRGSSRPIPTWARRASEALVASDKPRRRTTIPTDEVREGNDILADIFFGLHIEGCDSGGCVVDISVQVKGKTDRMLDESEDTADEEGGWRSVRTDLDLRRLGNLEKNRFSEFQVLGRLKRGEDNKRFNVTFSERSAGYNLEGGEALKKCGLDVERSIPELKFGSHDG